MNTKLLSLGIFLLMISGYAMADDLDHVRVRQLLQEGKILSLEQILDKVKEVTDGQLLEIELEEEQDMIIYEIEFLSENGRAHWLYIDAATGELLTEHSRERD